MRACALPKVVSEPSPDLGVRKIMRAVVEVMLNPKVLTLRGKLLKVLWQTWV